MDIDSNKENIEMDEVILPVGDERMKVIFGLVFSHHGCSPIRVVEDLLTISSTKISRRCHRIKITVSFPNSTLSVYDVSSLTDTLDQRKATLDEILVVFSFFDLNHRFLFGGWSDIEARHRFLEKYIGNVATPIIG
jgi:hypothetical protein